MRVEVLIKFLIIFNFVKSEPTYIKDYYYYMFENDWEESPATSWSHLITQKR
jgi:hypothetical protein